MLGFIHIEKTAGSTITQILRQSFGLRHCDVRSWTKGWRQEDDLFTAEDLSRTRRIYRNLQSIAGHGIKPYSDLRTVAPNLRYFTFLRDPLARCASHYQYQIQVMGKSIPFDEWMQQEPYRNFQTFKIAGEPSAEKAIALLQEQVQFVGLLDRFEESLIMFRRAFSDLPLNIYHRPKNVASNSSIKQKLLSNQRARAMLTEANQEDLKLYEFVTDILFPQQIRLYGEGLEKERQRFRTSNNPPPVLPAQLPTFIVRHLIYKPLVSISSWSRS